MAPGILPVPIRMRRVCYSHQSDCAESVACTSQTRQCMYVVRTNQIALKGLVISTITSIFFFYKYKRIASEAHRKSFLGVN